MGLSGSAARFPTATHNGQQKHVAGTTRTYTKSDVDNDFNPPDWLPGEHAALPDPVAHGKEPIVHACDQCHLTNGLGALRTRLYRNSINSGMATEEVPLPGARQI